MAQKQVQSSNRAHIYVGAIAFFMGTMGLALLTYWQYSRSLEKSALRIQIEQQLARPSQVYVVGASVPWQKVQVIGQFDETRSVLLKHQRYQSQSGWRLFTPLILENGQEVLVDRGWQVYPAERLQPDFATIADKEMQEEQIILSGVVQALPQRKGTLGGPIVNVHDRVLLFLDAAYILQKQPVGSTYIQALTMTHSDFIPAHTELPSSRKHQEYMLTWLALLVAWIIIFGAALRMRVNGQ